MVEALATGLMGIVVIGGGLYVAFRWIVMAGLPDRQGSQAQS